MREERGGGTSLLTTLTPEKHETGKLAKEIVTTKMQMQRTKRGIHHAAVPKMEERNESMKSMETPAEERGDVCAVHVRRQTRVRCFVM
jgi:hypothetical protein